MLPLVFDVYELRRLNSDVVGFSGTKRNNALSVPEMPMARLFTGKQVNKYALDADVVPKLIAPAKVACGQLSKEAQMRLWHGVKTCSRIPDLSGFYSPTNVLTLKHLAKKTRCWNIKHHRHRLREGGLTSITSA